MKAAAARGKKETIMAEAVSDGEQQEVKPPPKRRRILDPSAIVSVPVYSNKVNSSLQLKPTAAMLTEKEKSDDAADDSWSEFSSRGPAAATEAEAPALVHLSDSEEDEDEDQQKTTELEAVRCPSPPESPVRKQSRRVKQKISEINRKLQAVNSLLSPGPPDRKSSRDQDDDVIVVNPFSGLGDSPYSSQVREIPLKIRCRTDVHKVPVLSSTPLSNVVTQLSVILDVPPPRLLLLREEAELPTDSTVGELGLGIADIIECVVMAAEDKSGGGGGGDIITVRLQSKDRDSSQEFSLHRDAPLGSVFSRYVSGMTGVATTTVRFHFDGCKVTDGQTPAQLDMEDGDIIEVWV